MGTERSIADNVSHPDALLRGAGTSFAHFPDATRWTDDHSDWQLRSEHQLGLQLSYTNRRERVPSRNMDCLSARQGHGRQFSQLYRFDPGWASRAELPAWGVDVRPGYHRL